MKFKAIVSEIRRDVHIEAAIGGAIYAAPGFAEVECRVIPNEVPEGFLTPHPFSKSRDVEQFCQTLRIGLAPEEISLLEQLFTKIGARITEQVNR